MTGRWRPAASTRARYASPSAWRTRKISSRTRTWRWNPWAGSRAQAVPWLGSVGADVGQYVLAVLVPYGAGASRCRRSAAQVFPVLYGAGARRVAITDQC